MYLQPSICAVPYVGEKLRLESEYDPARACVKEIAHYEPNHIDVAAGEDLRNRERPKEGWIPIEGEGWSPIGPLLPYVEIFLMPRDARTPIRFTYEVRREAVGARRVLHIAFDYLTPTTSPITPEMVQANAGQLYQQVQPLVTGWFPLHNHVEAACRAGDPVARAMADGVSEGVHLRTPVLLSFGVPWEGLVDLRVTRAKARKGVKLLGPDGRPV